MATLSPSFYLTLSIDKAIWLGVTGENGEGEEEREREIWLSTWSRVELLSDTILLPLKQWNGQRYLTKWTRSSITRPQAYLIVSN